MKNIKTSITTVLLLTAATSFTVHAAVLRQGHIIGINFGNTASAEPGATWNDLSGVGVTGGGSSILAAGTLSSLGGEAVSGVAFTFQNNSSITTVALNVPGSDGNGGLIDHASVYTDGFKADGIGTDNFTYTFTGLNPGWWYTVDAGLHNGNSNFSSYIEINGDKKWVRTNNVNPGAFRNWSNLQADGSGTLVITQTEFNIVDRVALVGLTLTVQAAPEPSSLILLGMGAALLVDTRRRKQSLSPICKS